MNYHTAYFALARRGRIRPGDRIAIHGAAGGVGTAAIQVGRGLGAEVIAIAAGPDKMHIAERAGAHHVLDAEGDWVAALRAQNDGLGVDAILDPVGGERFDQSVRCLAPEGRLIVVGFTEGRIPSVQVESDPAQEYRYRRRRLGSLPGRQTIAVHRDAARARRDDRLRHRRPDRGGDIPLKRRRPR